MSRKIVFDADNPEWTAEDFKRSKPAGSLPPQCWLFRTGPWGMDGRVQM